MSKENRRPRSELNQGSFPSGYCLNINTKDFYFFHGTFTDNGSRAPMSRRSFSSMGYCNGSGQEIKVIGFIDGGLWHAKVPREDLAITQSDGRYGIDLGYEVTFHPRGSSGYNHHMNSLRIAEKNSQGEKSLVK